MISLVAPTSADCIATIARAAEGFLYVVSSLGVTGPRSEITTDLDSIIQVVRAHTSVPCAIGFGISTPEQAKKMTGLSDGAIVGSAIIKIIAGAVCEGYEGRRKAGMKKGDVRPLSDVSLFCIVIPGSSRQQMLSVLRSFRPMPV